MFTRKALAWMILPLTVEQIFLCTIGIADTWMVSCVGESAVSGVSLVDAINLLPTSLLSALATGGTIVCAQYLGRKDEENANLAAKHLILISGVLSLAVSLGCLAGNRKILELLYPTASRDVLQQSETYFFYSALSYLFIGLFSACSALFRSMGNARIPMCGSVLMSALNLILNAFFIYGLNWGVAGAGFASLLSRIFSTALLLGLLAGSHETIRMKRFFRLGWSSAMVRNILRLAVPTGVEDSIFHLGKLLVQGVVASYGTTAIAANAVVLSLSELTHAPGYAIGYSLITVVGQCVGAREYDQAQRYIKRITGLSYAVGAVLCAAAYLLAEPFTALYHLEPETARLAEEIIRFQAVVCLISWPAAFNIPDGLRAANDIRFTLGISLFSMWSFRVGLSYLFRAIWPAGVLTVWVAMGVDWVFRAVLFSLRLYGGRWKNRQFL